MRTILKRVFKHYFHNHLVRTRNELAWTQAQMAEVLAMAERSYVELDHGNSCCNSDTLMLYLSYCCDDPVKFINEFKERFEKETKVTV